MRTRLLTGVLLAGTANMQPVRSRAQARLRRLVPTLMALGLTFGLATMAGPAAADSTGEINGAISWATGEMNNNPTGYDEECLQFVNDAYASVGVSLGSADTAVDYWNAHASAQVGGGSTPPEGALVFWGATPYGKITYSNPDGHVALSLGNGNVISSAEESNNDIHEFTIAARNAAGYPYLGWMMPPGVTAPSGGGSGGSNPPPAVPSSNSGAIYNPATNFAEVFAEGPNNSLNTWWNLNAPTGSWNAQTIPNTAGEIYSSPAAVYNPATNFLEVFAEGPNNSLVTYWQTVGNGQGWSKPGTIGASSGTTYSSPAAVYNPSTNSLEVFTKGGSNGLNTYWTTVGSGTWGAETIPGTLGTTYSDPTAVLNTATNFLEVFAEGPNNSLNTWWEIVGDPTWSGPDTFEPSGTTYSDAVPIYNPSTNFLMVFAQGPSNSLVTYWQTVGNGQGWSGITIGGAGTTYSDPFAIYNPSTNFAEVIAEGWDNSLYAYWDTIPNSWNGPAAEPSGVTTSTYSDQAAVYNPATNFLEVFAQGWNNSLNAWQDTVGQAWTGFGAIAGTGTTYSGPGQ